jgi:hypothetical protein
MSARGPERGEPTGYPPPSSLRWGWTIPAEILDPLLHRPPADAATDAVGSKDGPGPDAEHAAG